MSLKQSAPLNPGLTWLLHKRHYRESSWLCELLTESFGRMSVIALGSQSKKRRAVLIPFQPLWAQLKGDGELKVLTHVESEHPMLPLLGSRSFCGLYINELILKSMTKHDPSPEVFAAYQTCLQQLSQPEQCEASTLRHFELTLLQSLGYGLPFDQLTSQYTYYRYCSEQGFVGLETAEKNSFTRAHIQAIQQRQWTSPELAKTAKHLMRQALQNALNHKSLNCRTLWQNVEST